MALSAWPPAWQAAWLLAVDPAGLGGLVLRGSASPVRDAVLADLRQALPPGTPWRRLPLQVDDERLLGGLDLGLSLAAGRPVHQAGLLAEAAGGVLLLPMAERAEAGLAGRLAAHLDACAGLCVLALDEGLDEDEALPASLSERLGLMVTVTMTVMGSGAMPLPDLLAARARLPAVPCDPEVVQALCATAAALGLNSMRTVWQAWCAARAAAALEGRAAVSQADAELAARLVLAPRARTLPQSPDVESQAAPPDASSAAGKDPGDAAEEKLDDNAKHGEKAEHAENARSDPQADEAHDTQPDTTPDVEEEALHDSARDGSRDPTRAPVPPCTRDPAQALQDQTLAAARAAIPPGLLESLAGGIARGGGSSGRKGAASRPAQSGRPLTPAAARCAGAAVSTSWPHCAPRSRGSGCVRPSGNNKGWRRPRCPCCCAGTICISNASAARRRRPPSLWWTRPAPRR
ncbi:hypothetical protein OU995_00150 [Roseateles sp. SL47]|uniref:hypothetical protein n=1 Tax=Roseateles sp. SL47 TaxID=2995138 RepID=UPI00226F966F|nr:hypothetical protein [Roseateles sp. SL47]WAC73205.1 hypothetical protein OU995_00150 [Roseateles sp. SL47]